MKEYHLTDLPLWADPEAFEILKQLCNEHRVPHGVLQDLVANQRESVRYARLGGITQAITEVLDQME